MKSPRISGGEVLDGLLEGGIEKGIITTIYGPGASGKTTAGMLVSSIVAEEKKVFFIDTEGGFSVERFTQIGTREKLKKILLLKPINFNEQQKNIETISKNINDKIGLVVVDTISSLYRVEKAHNVKQVNNMLNLQISWLLEIARKNNIPVLITAQVYSDFENKNKIKIVGGNYIKNSSKALVELESEPRKAIIRKHRSLPEEKEIYFNITGKGFEKAPNQTFE
ncbi:MAG: DNA repair and recombination protein RadB [Nanobdellota archaeon]